VIDNRSVQGTGCCSASFYRWLVQAGLLDTTPIAAVRRPSRDETPRQTRLTRHELADWLNAAEATGGIEAPHEESRFCELAHQPSRELAELGSESLELRIHLLHVV
jgi:site-specific recombinase XerC